MAEEFKVGDRVSWNSEAGHVSGTIIRVHTHDFDYKGHTHRATPNRRNTKSRAARLSTWLRTRARHSRSLATDASDSVHRHLRGGARALMRIG